MAIEDFTHLALRQGVEQQRWQGQVQRELAKDLHVAFGKHALTGEHKTQRDGQVNRASDIQDVKRGTHPTTQGQRVNSWLTNHRLNDGTINKTTNRSKSQAKKGIKPL